MIVDVSCFSQIVNLQSSYVNVTVTLNGVDSGSVKGSKVTILTSADPYDSNTFDNPTEACLLLKGSLFQKFVQRCCLEKMKFCLCVQVIPKSSSLDMDGNQLNAILKPYSLTAFDLLTTSGEATKAQRSPQTIQTPNHGRFAKFRKQISSKHSNSKKT